MAPNLAGDPGADRTCGADHDGRPSRPAPRERLAPRGYHSQGSKVPQLADTLDLETLTLRPGEGRTIDARIRVEPLELGGQPYTVKSSAVDAQLDVSRTLTGYALRLRFDAPLEGACM